ncbi:hypothetical protein [Aureimonas sp. AU4]|uniref:hypothetical protein n=1 Tax=Aureimonas sp. AU4 TaxID=1638163 RepID=UPI0012E3FA62|nr:hypothetical protein [Aureimonas sp. AU4]
MNAASSQRAVTLAASSPPPSQTPVSPAPASASPPAVIVFGLDDTGKPHASAFDASEATLARKAAALMGMSTLSVTTDADRSLAARVPKGRLFASGKGFVPFVKAGLYAELLALKSAAGPSADASLNSPATAPAASETTMSTAAQHKPTAITGFAQVPQPTHWADVQVGAIVLAAIAPKHTEWYECQVIGVEASDRFTLRFCDWPNETPFTRQRAEIGLMHPSREVDPPAEASEPATRT